MIDVINELRNVRNNLSKRKLGITYAIQEEGIKLSKAGFLPNFISDEDLPKFGVREISAYYLLVQIVEADTTRPIPEVLRQSETWTVLANKTLEGS